MVVPLPQSPKARLQHGVPCHGQLPSPAGSLQLGLLRLLNMREKMLLLREDVALLCTEAEVKSVFYLLMLNCGSSVHP